MSRLADDLRETEELFSAELDLWEHGRARTAIRCALAVVEAANELEPWLDDDDFGMGAKQALAKFRQALEG